MRRGRGGVAASRSRDVTVRTVLITICAIDSVLGMRERSAGTRGHMGISREARVGVDTAHEAREGGGVQAALAARTARAALAHGRHDGTATAVLDFAAAQLLGVLGDDTPLGVLPAVLERLPGGFGLRAGLAFPPGRGQLPPGLGGFPADAADPALLAKIGALSLAQRKGTGPVQLTLEPGEGSAGAGPGKGPLGAGAQ